MRSVITGLVLVADDEHVLNVLLVPTCSKCIFWSNKLGISSRRRRNKFCLMNQTTTLDGMTSPQGPAAWGRAHPGGIFTGTFSTQGSISPPVNWPPVIHLPSKKSSPVHRSTGHCSNKCK